MNARTSVSRTGCDPFVVVATYAVGLALVLAGCTSARSTEEAAPPSSGLDLSKGEMILTLIDQTPDHLAALPSPLFYRSPAPRTISSEGDFSSHLDVEIIGGVHEGRAQWALRIEHTVSDTTQLSPTPFVDLFDPRLVMRRGHEWRSIQTRRDSLTDIRYVPLRPADVTRLARADRSKIQINRNQFSLPDRLRPDYQTLHQATPDSLVVDTANVKNVLTVYHTVDRVQEGPDELKKTVAKNIKYPEEARQQEIEGKVLVEFVGRTDGTPTHIRVIDGVHPLLNQAAQRTIQKLNFSPGVYRHQEVPVLMRLPVHFHLQ